MQKAQVTLRFGAHNLMMPLNKEGGGHWGRAELKDIKILPKLLCWQEIPLDLWT